MAAPYVNLIGGLRAFDHDVTVGEESILTLVPYMEGDASRITYCSSGESVFRGHAAKRPPLVDRLLPYGPLCRPLAAVERVFFLPWPDSSCEDEDIAAGPETFALQSALHTVNQPSLPHTLADNFLDGGVVRNFHAPDTTLDTLLPLLFEGTTLLLGRCSRTLCKASVYYGLRASIFQYSCDALVVRAFFDTWSPEMNMLITCQSDLSITLLDMDRIFGLPIFGQFYDEDDVVFVHDPWTAWHAAYEKGAANSRERTALELDVFYVLHVMPGKEDEVHLAALLLVCISCDDQRSTVFKVASYMATWIHFGLACPALACLYRGLGQATAGLSTIVQWPYLYSWLVIYFHTHGEDLEGVRRPSMVSFGNPSVQRVFDEEQARDLFRRLLVLVWNRYVLGVSTISSLVDESKASISRPAYESLLSVPCCYLTARRCIRLFIETYNPTRFARQFGYCQDLPGDLGAKASQ
ncbi:hypothetical protein H6P81_016217 [Aristolochia fimbriata]|uniref:Aminotransferase-like plant mobile domain-containing protein n=1 Tax=Aristolochia fimbriata TaxID=158543 RepID=A0AAV7E7Q6_ARIFI|nr:hypothetical protein H6P81_016217 [Aristolochia fimbriata]